MGLAHLRAARDQEASMEALSLGPLGSKPAAPCIGPPWLVNASRQSKERTTP